MLTMLNVCGGALADAAERSIVYDPALLEAVGQVPDSGPGEVDAAVAAANQAFRASGWATDAGMRQAALRNCHGRIEAHAQELARLLSREQGKPLAAAQAEIGMALRILAHYAGYVAGRHILRDTLAEHIEVLPLPLGVAGLIVPWNYPLAILFMKLAPALATGNTVVIKPAPSTPLATLRLAQLLADLLPPGVLNTVTGEGQTGAALVAHPGISKISFTGSTPTGVRVMQGAAATLKRLTLELGGNDAAIVLDDVDVDEVAPRLYANAFTNAGQICCAIKRLYVHRRVLPALAERLADMARQWRVGPGLEPGVQMGPLHNAAQLRHVQALLEDARARGATVLAGGTACDAWPGHFLRPAIVTGISDEARLAREEQFGPALPLLAFDDEQDAVTRANASEYGLGASVWSADVERASSLAVALHAGNLYVNQHTVPPDPEIPFGGMKASGFGHELGHWGADDYTQRRVLSVLRTGARS